MRTLMLPVCLASLVLSSLSPAQRAVDAAASSNAAIEKAFADLTALRKEVAEAQKPLTEKMRDKETTAEEREKITKELMALRQRTKGPTEAFETMFAAAAWKSFDKEKHADLLKDGLMTQTRNSKSPQRAVEACNLYLDWFGSERAATGIRLNALPMALLGVGKVDEATKGLTTFAAEAEGGVKARALVTAGDIAAATGNIDEANKQYAAAEAVGDEQSAKTIELRTALIGKTAPEIDSKSWIGGTATPLSGLTGKVVIVDFWATWCGPCRMVMPALSAMYEEKKAEGLEVLGVTRFYKNGYMPRTKAETQTGGESLQSISEADFPAHVSQFQKVTEIKYPFVIAGEDDFKNYKISGIPTLCVLDRTGKVALVAVGSGSEPLVHLAVERLLAKK